MKTALQLLEAHADALAAELAEAQARLSELAAQRPATLKQRVETLEAWFKEIGAMIPMHGGGTFVNDPPDAIVDAMRRFLGPVAASALETAAEPDAPCRIAEYDGAFKCLTHQKTWGAITNAGQPCAGFDEAAWYQANRRPEHG